MMIARLHFGNLGKYPNTVTCAPALSRVPRGPLSGGWISCSSAREAENNPWFLNGCQDLAISSAA